MTTLIESRMKVFGRKLLKLWPVYLWPPTTPPYLLLFCSHSKDSLRSNWFLFISADLILKHIAGRTFTFKKNLVVVRRPNISCRVDPGNKILKVKTILLKENLGTGHGKLPDTGSKNSPCKSIFVSSDFAKRQSNTGPWLLPTLLSGVNGTEPGMMQKWNI